LKAIERYEIDRGTAFTTFAVPTIAGELKRHLRDHTRLVRIPRALKDLSTPAARAKSDLEARLGRVPTASELATETGAPIEQILELRIALDAQRGESLDADTRDDDTSAMKLRVGVHESGFERAEACATLCHAHAWSKEALELVSPLIADPEPEVRLTLITHIDQLSGDRELLRAGLEDDDPRVSSAARRTLDRLEG